MLLPVVLLAATLVAPPAPPIAVDPVADLLAQLNAERQAAGLSPLRAEPALAKLAAARAGDAARTGDFDGSPETIRTLTQDLRRAGYPPYSWRQRLVQGPHDAAALVRQWKSSDPQGFTAVVLGDYEGFGAAVAPDAQPPLWSLLVALPRLTWERRLETPELVRALDDAWLLLLASRSEGTPRVVLEALCRGRAVVGARAGGIPDVVTHGETGLLVDPDRPDEIAEALVRILSDRPLAERLGAGGHARSGEWTYSADEAS